MRLKLSALLFLFTTLCVNLYAQHWMQTAGGATVDEGYSVAVDGSGNAVSVGYFTGVATFGPVSLVSSGSTDMYITKLNSNGVVQWAHKAGGSGNDRAFSVKTDGSGNNFVVGYFSGTASFGTQSVTSQGLQDVFIAKYNSAGAFQWVQTAGGPNNDNATGVALSPSGDIYITGLFKDTATFGNIGVSGNPTTNDVFTAKISSSGVFTWVETGSGVGNNYGVDIGCDNNGNVYTTGMFSDTITFDNVLNNNMQNAVFLVKYNGSGVEQWVKVIGGATNNDVTGIAVDGSGASFITGNYAGTLTFFGVGAGSNTTLPTTYAQAVYLAKISTTGGVAFSHSLGSDNLITSNGVGIDGSGNSVIGGKFECGLSEAQVTFGDGVFNSINDADMFVCKYTATGGIDLLRHIGGEGDDEVFGVDLDNTGQVIIAGSYEEELVVPTNGSFNTTNLALFTSLSYPSNNNYCSDPSYGEFHNSASAGNKDIWVGKCFPSNRAPLDFYNRVGSGCVRDIRPLCMDSVCSTSLTDCEVIMDANPQILLGVAPEFDFNWSSNAQPVGNGESANAPTSGTYSLTATTADNCLEVTQSINVTVLPAPTNLKVTDSKGLNFMEENPAPIEICLTDTVTITGYGGYVGNYNWSGPSLPAGGLFDSVFVTNTPGQYIFSVLTAAGCSLELEIEVISVPPLDPWGLKMVTPDTHIICEGDFIVPFIADTISNPGEISQCLADSTYELITTWSVVPNTPISNGCNTYGAFAPDSTNTYTISATVVRSNACGADTTYVTKDIYVEVHPAPVLPPINLVVTGGPNLCPGGSLVLTASGGTTYEWFGPGLAFDTTASVTITQPGIYGIATTTSDTNAAGCVTTEVASTTINITLKPQPTISASSLILCPNDSVGLVCSEVDGLNWFGPNGPLGDSNLIYVTDPGSYYCVVNDSDSCGLVSNTVVISQYATPFLMALGDSILCPGDTTYISAQTGATSTLEWQAPLSGNNPTQTITVPGTYTCKITSCGIESYASITIHSPSFLANFTVSGPLCADSFVTLTADTGLATYLWSPTNDTTSSITVSSPGDYSLFVSEINGCSGNSDTVTISQIELNPQITGIPAICPGDSTLLTASPQGGQVQWSHSADTSFQTWVSQADAYVVTITDSNGCVATSAVLTVNIADTSAQVFVMGDTLICSDDSVQLTTNPFDSASYVWQPNADTTPEIWVTQPGWYSVAIVDDFGCNRNAGPVYVEVEQNTLNIPEVSDDTTLCFGKMAELWATGSEGEPHWYVQPEDTLVHVGTNFLALAGIESTYMVTMQTSVCTSDVAWVTLFGKDCYGLIAPNIFTPNGDGMNDYFQVYVVEGTCYKLEIYNRWGNLVHQSELVNSEWDGTMMTTGKKLSDGVYFWLLDYCDVDGASHEAKGTVTLSRGE